MLVGVRQWALSRLADGQAPTERRLCLRQAAIVGEQADGDPTLQDIPSTRATAIDDLQEPFVAIWCSLDHGEPGRPRPRRTSIESEVGSPVSRAAPAVALECAADDPRLDASDGLAQRVAGLEIGFPFLCSAMCDGIRARCFVAPQDRLGDSDGWRTGSSARLRSVQMTLTGVRGPRFRGPNLPANRPPALSGLQSIENEREMEPTNGLEPLTCSLRVSCSTS